MYISCTWVHAAFNPEGCATQTTLHTYLHVGVCIGPTKSKYCTVGIYMYASIVSPFLFYSNLFRVLIIVAVNCASKYCTLLWPARHCSVCIYDVWYVCTLLEVRWSVGRCRMQSCMYIEYSTLPRAEFLTYACM